MSAATKPDPTENERVETAPVRIEASIEEKARAIVTKRRISMSEYLSPMIRAQVERDYKQLAREYAKHADAD